MKSIISKSLILCISILLSCKSSKSVVNIEPEQKKESKSTVNTPQETKENTPSQINEEKPSKTTPQEKEEPKNEQVKYVVTEKTAPTLFNFDPSTTLGNVLQRAKREHKWVYVDISAEWCAPCQIMNRDVYTDKEAAAFFNENFITYHVDVEKDEGPDLKLIFEVQSYPTLLFIDEKGRVMLKKESALTASGLLKFGQEAKTLKL